MQRVVAAHDAGRGTLATMIAPGGRPGALREIHVPRQDCSVLLHASDSLELGAHFPLREIVVQGAGKAAAEERGR